MKFAVAAAALLIVVVSVLAGALVFPRTVVKTRVVHVVDPRPLISNGALPSAVLANLDGKPRSHPDSPWPLFECSMYGSPYKVVADVGAPAFILEVCTRGLVS